MDNTEREMVYKKNGDMWRLVDSTFPTKPVNSKSSEGQTLSKAYWMSKSGATVLLISAWCKCV